MGLERDHRGAIAKLEAALKITIHAEIPSDRVVPISVNKGTPAVISESGSDFSKAMVSLAKSLTPTEGRAKRRKLLSLPRS